MLRLPADSRVYVRYVRAEANRPQVAGGSVVLISQHDLLAVSIHNHGGARHLARALVGLD